MATFCSRTGRPCDNGAFDGGDGFGIDCIATIPDDCEFCMVTLTCGKVVNGSDIENTCRACNNDC